MQSGNTLYVLEESHVFKYPYGCMEFKPDPKNQVTCGDMHGNAIKFLDFLIFTNVINLLIDSYNKLVNIYKKDILTKEDLSKFNALLEKTTFNSVGKVRLIGDLLSDRGKNDLLTLKILEKLSLNKMDCEILFSNHDAMFLGWLLKDKPDEWPSLTGLIDSIEQGLISKDSVKELVEKYYLPNLKLVSYSIDYANENKPTLFLYSHACIGLETIAELAKFYDILTRTKMPINYVNALIISMQSLLHQILLKNIILKKQNCSFITVIVMQSLIIMFLLCTRLLEQPTQDNRE